MVTKGEPKPLAKAFIDYMKSDSGAEITRQTWINSLSKVVYVLSI